MVNLKLIRTEAVRNSEAFRAVVFEIDPESGDAPVLDIIESDTEEFVVEMATRYDDLLAKVPEGTPGAVAVGNHWGIVSTRDPGSRATKPAKLLFQTCRRHRLIAEMPVEERLEERVYNEQEKMIRESYGRRAAKMANYGWGVDGTDEYIYVETKVYGHGVLCSRATFSTGLITHNFQE
jgi:hypothetical protein